MLHRLIIAHIIQNFKNATVTAHHICVFLIKCQSFIICVFRKNSIVRDLTRI